ncbi:hypothetical protein [Macrococcoides bohemicum]|nr:hypothetical protein [Macrococcus bohemicus]MBC9873545.1 hypothetical protein [Macrococcus bohemicus]
MNKRILIIFLKIVILLIKSIVVIFSLYLIEHKLFIGIDRNDRNEEIE